MLEQICDSVSYTYILHFFFTIFMVSMYGENFNNYYSNHDRERLTRRSRKHKVLKIKTFIKRGLKVKETYIPFKIWNKSIL